MPRAHYFDADAITERQRFISPLCHDMLPVSSLSIFAILITFRARCQRAAGCCYYTPYMMFVTLD